YVVLRQENVREPLVVGGLSIAKPQQFGCLEAGQRGITGNGHQRVPPDPIGYLDALRRGALVVPKQRRSDDAVFRVEEHSAVHLAGYAEACDLPWHCICHCSQDVASGLPPILWVLLSPSRPGGVQRVLVRGRGKDHARLVHGKSSRTGCADVEPDYDAHVECITAALRLEL